MRYIKNIFSLVFLTALLFSCNDEFMERYPLDEISGETYWNSELDLKNYNNRIYETSRTNDQINVCFRANTYNRSFFDRWTNITTSTYRTSSYNRYRSGKDPVRASSRQHGWRGWNLLRQINHGLANYHKADVTERVRNKYIAEAKFFRAWFFAQKVSLFGDVPYTSKALNIDDDDILYGSRMPREQAMDSILADINFAVEHLPENWQGAVSPSSSGRFNKWHALHIKARMCLFEGTWRQNHGGSDPDFWLEQAADAAKEIIDDGPYGIYSTGDPHNDYTELFARRETSIKLWDNPEAMYWREYQFGSTNTTHMMQTYWHHNAGATKAFVDDYLMIDGKPPITTEGVSHLYAGDKTIEDVFQNRDNRMRQTLLYPEDKQKYNYFPDNPDAPHLLGSGIWKSTSTGYHHIKFFNWEMLNRTWGEIDQPAIIMRYAETLLIYAEAKAELGTITQADLDITINALRDRVDMPHLRMDNVPVDPRYANLVSPLIAEIRRERKIELAFEGFRLFDIYRWKWGHEMEMLDLGIRWDEDARARFDYSSAQGTVIQDPITGEMNEYLDIHKGTAFDNPVFEDKHYLWPIPLGDLSENPNLGQNPGWE